MSFDLVLKKHFDVLVLSLVAVCAYFQAAGVTQLVGSSLIGEFEGAPPKNSSFVPAPFTRPSAKAIWTRNAFDSVTGPFEDKSSLRVEVGSISNGNPLTVARCDDLAVQIVSESSDPLWSFATMQARGESRPVLRRVGDQVGGRRLIHIGFNPLEASPAVWLQGKSVCQTLLFAELSPSPGTEPRGTPAASTTDGDISIGIQKVSDTHFRVDRTIAEMILEDPTELMRSVRVVPEKKNGEVVGIRLFGIRDGTLFGLLGLQNGDRLETVNGVSITTPEKALRVYASARSETRLTLALTRRGRPLEIDVDIE